VNHAPVQLGGHRIFVGLSETGDSTDERWLAMNDDGGLLTIIPNNERKHGLVERLAYVCWNWFRVVNHV
jgi:hypothetical protein